MDRDKAYVDRFYKEATRKLEDLLDAAKKILQPEHPTDHKPQMVRGNCQVCRWLDPEAKENKIEGPAGNTVLEAAQSALSDLELALAAIKAMTPEQFIAVAFYIKNATVSDLELVVNELLGINQLEKQIDDVLARAKGPIQ